MICRDLGQTEIFDVSTLIAIKKMECALELQFTSGKFILEYPIKDATMEYVTDLRDKDYIAICKLKKEVL
jgi:hypothetical protein